MTDTLQGAPSRRALLLIDFQDDFLGSQARMPVCRTQVASVLAAAGQAVARARLAGDLVIAIGNEFRPGDYFMNLLRRRASIAGSSGSQWTDALPLQGIRYFPKWAGSAFVNPELDTCLRAHDIGTLVLSGLFAKACVAATCRNGLARGYNVELVSDAIACRSNASRDRALARLKRQGAQIADARHYDPCLRMSESERGEEKAHQS